MAREVEAASAAAVRWVSVARGFEEDPSGSSLDALDDFLYPYGYGWADVKRMDWLAAAVLADRGASLREYAESRGGDLSSELAACEADALAAMAGSEPTEASLRHDLRHRGFRKKMG